jgi:hypothetical protein
MDNERRYWLTNQLSPSDWMGRLGVKSRDEKVETAVTVTERIRKSLVVFRECRTAHLNPRKNAVLCYASKVKRGWLGEDGENDRGLARCCRCGFSAFSPTPKIPRRIGIVLGVL